MRDEKKIMDVNRLHERRHTLLVRTNLVGRPIMLPSVLLSHNQLVAERKERFVIAEFRRGQFLMARRLYRYVTMPDSRLLRDGVRS
jgi:hypothetical protein